MDGMKAGAVPTAINQQAREFDNFVEAQHEQLASLTSAMRRVEDLAERVLGSIPAEAGNNKGPASHRAGHFGALLDAHEARDEIGGRIVQALSRIERVL
ncbi:hypothetical protein [Sphingomonas sp.]|uniref:hypothetical protein n=1 Tax=Sphingomonas sp. TaxID=28214 RepID=UPI0025ED1C3A|nr:hypothetical protein [Sphingomonas sp.]